MSRKQTAELATLSDGTLNTEFLFSGGKFALEKRPIPLILSINYIILGVVILCNAPFGLQALCWTVVIFSLGAGILTKIRGRWLALMAFSVPILVKILETGMGRMDFMVLWIVALISLSAAYSSFNVISGLMRWLKGRRD